MSCSCCCYMMNCYELLLLYDELLSCYCYMMNCYELLLLYGELL